MGGPRISTADVSATEAFDWWAAVQSESMTPCSTQPLPGGPFSASIGSCVESEPISIAQLAISGSITHRNHRHIARSDTQYVLAYLTTAGRFDVRFGGDFLRAPAGTMFVVDGQHPQEAIASDFEAIMVRVPRELLLSATGLSEDDFPRARRLQPVGHEALVIDYFRRLVEPPANALGNIAMLNAGIELLAAALALGVEQRPDEPAANSLLRQHVIAFIRANLGNPGLTVDRIAFACGISRRKLFGLFTDIDGGPMQLLRQLRAERAQELLIATPDQTIAAIAHACGFTGERNLYRVFRAETGITPGEYREHVLHGHPAPAP
ncbi:AraC family transcriptional regulator [Nocardia tengchongensis]|uniref:helix-turn-helix transcriptional regulator n=1 Tax=Nocardia tengchongensis TaxID=2055889 RepID=UPI0036776C37